MNLDGNTVNEYKLNIMNIVCAQTPWQLISIPGCDNKSWTIST